MGMKKISSEAGTGAGSILAAIAALGIAGLYVKNQSQKIEHSIANSRSAIQSFAASDASMNSLSRVKALLNTSLQPSGLYLPALVASNYYEGSWNLNTNPDVIMNKVKLDSQKTIFIENTNFEDKTGGSVEEVLRGTKTQADLASEGITISILDTRFSGDKRLAESVDVQVTFQKKLGIKNQTKVSKARISLKPPDPFNPILEISPAGTEAWSRDFSNVLGGDYDLRVLGSGIVFDATVEINGAFAARLGGWDLKTGEISHKANNYLATNVEVGRFKYTFGSGGGTGSFSETSCLYERTGGGSGSNMVKIVLNGPLEKVASEPKIAHDFAIEVKGGSGEEAIGRTLTFDDYKNNCKSECPTAENWDPWFAEGKFPQLTAERFPRYATSLGVPDKKLCVTFAKVADNFKAINHRFPSTYEEIQTLNDEELGFQELFTYEVPSCTGRFLFQRKVCGCLATDTKILLGNRVSTKLISELTETDLVWNPVLHQAMKIRRMTQGPETKAMIRIIAGQQEVKVTGNHPFPTPSGIKAAFLLRLGDLVQGVNGEWVPIKSIETMEAGSVIPTVWNLELEGDDSDAAHFIVANGVVTGDLWIQGNLQSANFGNKK